MTTQAGAPPASPPAPPTAPPAPGFTMPSEGDELAAALVMVAIHMARCERCTRTETNYHWSIQCSRGQAIKRMALEYGPR